MPTHMQVEVEETPEALRRFLRGSAEAVAEAGERLRRLDPPLVVTIARGSSDHAAAYFKYACEIAAGTPVASLGPSVVTLYGARLRLAGAAALAVSQSGASPDLVALTRAAAAGGAASFALVNAEGSPLAVAADHVVPLRAGPERSTAATKSFVVSAAAGLALIAAWRRDGALAAALEALPERLEAALACDWSAAVEPLVAAGSLYVLGRGLGFPMALEAALKFKETAALHAEAFSGAEVRHGPSALAEEGFPVFALIPRDAAADSLERSAADLAAQGARLFVASAAPGPGLRLPAVTTGHGLTEPLALILSFYRFIERLSGARGRDPDNPRHLRKVTRTL